MLEKGKKVVCICSNWDLTKAHEHNCDIPIKDDVYTIKKVTKCSKGYYCLQFDELDHGYLTHGYDANEFRLVDERFAEDLIKELEEEINEEILHDELVAA